LRDSRGTHLLASRLAPPPPLLLLLLLLLLPPPVRLSRPAAPRTAKDWTPLKPSPRSSFLKLWTLPADVTQILPWKSFD